MPKVRAALHIAQPTIAAAISCQSNVASLISFTTERMKVINAPAIESSNHFQPVASCCSAKAAVEHAAINPPMPRCAYLSICIILFFGGFVGAVGASRQPQKSMRERRFLAGFAPFMRFKMSRCAFYWGGGKYDLATAFL